MKYSALMLASALLLVSCQSGTQEEKSELSESTSATSETDQSTLPQANTQSANLDLENIPVTDKDIGTFPYFTLPKGLKALNKPFQKNLDVCFFPINGIMTPFEGKLYKINISEEQGEQFSKIYLERSLENYLNSIGAVKVFDGEIGREEYERYNKQDPNKGDEGDIGYADENIKFYVIRNKKEGNIYIQFSANNAAGKLNILQEAGFEQTIEKITADEIVKDLKEKGKSILYINFDTDKANINSDGKEVVEQISAALKKENTLAITIEGHTDNTGNAAHNKKLSKDRADAVMHALTTDGIDQTRLTAAGFGSERPLVANDTEDNKAKNRRVELIKTN